MNGFKKFVKNENDNWEEYKDLINEDTKFMMRDEDGNETEMTTREVINQLYQDNKALEHYIHNLQSKIDKAIEMIEFDKKDRMWDLGEGNIMILQEKRVNEILDILKGSDK